MRKKYVVLTSIYPPTIAVKKYASFKDCCIVVAGDNKTPSPWRCNGVTFLSTEQQKTLPYHIMDGLPYDSYSRKMVGYMYAMNEGADIIIDSDDDNIPMDDWSFPKFAGEFKVAKRNMGFVNVYKSFTSMHIWPRGFPLELIKNPDNLIKEEDLALKHKRIGVWQALANEDPDVDAIYRLAIREPCYFSEGEPMVLDSGTISPFNSQNTAFRKELFPLLYLPAFVTFRFSDILRSLVAQPIMWKAGFRLGITKATVVHDRNPHDYLKDFVSEIPCYLHANRVIEVVSRAIKSEFSIQDNLFQSYDALCAEGIVVKEELALLALWLKDVGV